MLPKQELSHPCSIFDMHQYSWEEKPTCFRICYGSSEPVTSLTNVFIERASFASDGLAAFPIDHYQPATQLNDTLEAFSQEATN